MKKVKFLTAFSIASICIWACSNDSNSNDDNGTTPSLEVPAVYKKIYGASSISNDGTYITIKSTGLPEHKSPYYANTQWASTLYVADTRPGFIQAPGNKIDSFSYTFKIPLNPTPATSTTPLGAATIGVAINGVPLFNQYQMQGNAITVGSGEYVSFDLYGGHPTPFNEYHYHIEPNYLTTLKGSSELMGFLLDGYPLYGPVENGTTLTSSNLDQYHGHTTATADYPNGIYHYHITADSPYINGNGYKGVPGTWSK
jgi:YHYH protein